MSELCEELLALLDDGKVSVSSHDMTDSRDPLQIVRDLALEAGRLNSLLVVDGAVTSSSAGHHCRAPWRVRGMQLTFGRVPQARCLRHCRTL